MLILGASLQIHRIFVQQFPDSVCLFRSEGIHSFSFGRSSSRLKHEQVPTIVDSKLPDTRKGPLDSSGGVVLVLEDDMRRCYFQKPHVYYSSLIVDVLDFKNF